jgi:hypothetical protein
MKKAEVVVTLVTIYAVIFQAAPFLGFGEQLIFSMFFLSPFFVLYMVYMVLKFGEPSRHTFDERFYDDWDYKRNGVEESGTQP